MTSLYSFSVLFDFLTLRVAAFDVRQSDSQTAFSDHYLMRGSLSSGGYSDLALSVAKVKVGSTVQRPQDKQLVYIQ